LWDASKGEFEGVVCNDSLEGDPLDCIFSDLVGSADGERIALGAASGKIHIFNLRFAKQGGPSFNFVKSLDTIDKNTKPLPYSLSFDPQNHDRLLAAYMPSPYMALWKIGENSHCKLGDDKSGPVWRAAIDPKDGSVASATADNIVRLWEVESASAVQLRGHLASVFALDISAENGNIASGSFDGTIRLWGKDSPLSPKLLSNTACMPPEPNKFAVEDCLIESDVRICRISVIGRDGKTCLGTLPQGFGEASAAAVSENGKAIAVVPRYGRPVLLVTFSDQLTVSVNLYDVKAEWGAVAFIEDDTKIVARTNQGKIFAWPFYSDVHSLEQVADEHLPLVREAESSDKRLTLPANILRKVAQHER
jgi:hypothetical protein